MRAPWNCIAYVPTGCLARGSTATVTEVLVTTGLLLCCWGEGRYLMTSRTTSRVSPGIGTYTVLMIGSDGAYIVLITGSSSSSSSADLSSFFFLSLPMYIITATTMPMTTRTASPIQSIVLLVPALAAIRPTARLALFTALLT